MGAVLVARGDAADDARRHIRHQLLVQREGLGEGEAPAGLKGAPNHGAAGGGRGTGQAERVGKGETAHGHADVHQVHLGEHSRKAGVRIDDQFAAAAELLLHVLVHEPGGGLSVIHRLDGGLRDAGNVAAAENPVLAGAHRRRVDQGEAV